MADIIILALVVGYCAWVIVHRRKEAKLAARMGKIMGCAGCASCSCEGCQPLSSPGKAMQQ